jgi:hypothetical protein
MNPGGLNVQQLVQLRASHWSVLQMVQDGLLLVLAIRLACLAAREFRARDVDDPGARASRALGSASASDRGRRQLLAPVEVGHRSVEHCPKLFSYPLKDLPAGSYEVRAEIGEIL